jgi:hypothetical protein
VSSEDRESPALDAIIAEAKEHLEPPELDWARLESNLMAQVAQEEKDQEATASPDRPALIAGAFTLAAAAAVALFAHRAPPIASAPVEPAASVAVAAPRLPAGSLRAVERLTRGEQVEIGDEPATTGRIVRDGDTIAALGARAIFERDTKVVWLVESDDKHPEEAARVRVTQVKEAAGEPLVLGLESGIIEAQVTPIPAGEAFAVDVATDQGSVRVAVHGTHLRVAREGTHVVVDLTEGVVAIGVPPVSGITQGTTVTAPAHVELDATDLSTLRIEHSPVRPAIPLSVRGAPVHAAAVPRPAPVAAAPSQVAVREAPPPEPAPPEPVASPKAAAPPRDAIVKAVRDCAASHYSRRGEVRVTVTSSLKLRLYPTGEVQMAQFSPPLPPEIQTCTASTVYKMKFDEPGPITVPIEYSY